jgi:hypothetical protein
MSLVFHQMRLKALLLEVAGSREDAHGTAEKIVHELGNLALAIIQAGPFIIRTWCSLAHYMELYHQHHDLLEKYKDQVHKVEDTVHFYIMKGSGRRFSRMQPPIWHLMKLYSLYMIWKKSLFPRPRSFRGCFSWVQRDRIVSNSLRLLLKFHHTHLWRWISQT